MRINCPHCRHDIEVVTEQEPVSCPSCGSRLHFFDETLVQTGDAVKVVDEFELLERVGRGHFGDVWKAHDSKLDRFVAVKIPRTRQLDEATLRLFVREARAAAKLRHDNIVAVHQVVQDKDSVYIVSDFIHGVTLAEELRFKGRSPREAAELCTTIADALDYAHNNGVNAHRDVKPGNIMIDTDGKPYVMDFGLAKLEAADFTMTVAGQILGTPSYMSPEQAQGIEADHRTDVYSLGVVLYELLTRNRPFTGETRLLVQQILHEEPRPPRKIDKSIPRNLETICLKAMSKEPERRYGTAAELAADLQRFLNGEPIQAQPVSTFERSWRWAKRNPIVAATSGAAAVLAVVLGVMLWMRIEENRQRQAEIEAGFRHVVLDTDPTGAKVVFVPIDEITHLPIEDRIVRPSMVSPVNEKLEPGTYLVVAEVEDHGFHEVYRDVPDDPDAPGPPFPHADWNPLPGGQIQLPTITIPRTPDVIVNMARIDGGTFDMGGDDIFAAPTHSREVDAYYLDQTEVTIAQYAEIFEMPDRLADRPPDEPATLVSFDQALSYAERVGKRLMTEDEYEFAATNGGTSTFPWGEDPTKVVPGILQPQPVRQPTFDQTPTAPPVYGLYSNVTEWTDSALTHYPTAPLNAESRPMSERWARILRDSRVIRGGFLSEKEHAADPAPLEELRQGPRRRASQGFEAQLPYLGFRCARSIRPRFLE